MDKKQEQELFETLATQDKELRRLARIVHESTIPKHPPGLPKSHYYRFNEEIEDES